MDVSRPIDTVDETHGFVCLRRSTDEEVHHSLGRSTVILKQGIWLEGNGLGYNVRKLYKAV